MVGGIFYLCILIISTLFYLRRSLDLSRVFIFRDMDKCLCRWNMRLWLTLSLSFCMVAQCNQDQWEAINKKLHPEAELLCALHFGAPYQDIRILQDIFRTTPFYNKDMGETSFTTPKIRFRCCLFLKHKHHWNISLIIHGSVLIRMDYKQIFKLGNMFKASFNKF